MPFNLTFGSDAIVPMEIEINSLRMVHFEPKQNESSLRANLNLLDEIREDACVKAIAKQRQIA